MTRVIHVVAENEALEKTLETTTWSECADDGVEKEIKTFIETYPTAAKSNTGVAQAIGVREFLDETDDDTETRFEKMCCANETFSQTPTQTVCKHGRIERVSFGADDRQ